jgi:hypothetical protein
MDILGTVTDDSATCPVQSLALGVWALTKTGSSALIPDLGVSSPLAGMTLTQLTEFLLSQQVPAGEPGAGSFYWRFDHAGPDGSDLDPDNAAFTEDLTYSVLALMSAYDATGDPRYSIAADLGRNVFTSGVDEDGTVYAHIPPGEECPSYYVYAGGGLQIMTPEPGTLALFVMGSLALARRRRRRRASPNA